MNPKIVVVNKIQYTTRRYNKILRYQCTYPKFYSKNKKAISDKKITIIKPHKRY